METAQTQGNNTNTRKQHKHTRNNTNIRKQHKHTRNNTNTQKQHKHTETTQTYGNNTNTQRRVQLKTYGILPSSSAYSSILGFWLAAADAAAADAAGAPPVAREGVHAGIVCVHVYVCPRGGSLSKCRGSLSKCPNNGALEAIITFDALIGARKFGGI